MIMINIVENPNEKKDLISEKKNSFLASEVSNIYFSREEKKNGDVIIASWFELCIHLKNSKEIKIKFKELKELENVYKIISRTIKANKIKEIFIEKKMTEIMKDEELSDFIKNEFEEIEIKVKNE